MSWNAGLYILHVRTWKEMKKKVTFKSNGYVLSANWSLRFGMKSGTQVVSDHRSHSPFFFFLPSWWKSDVIQAQMQARRVEIIESTSGFGTGGTWSQFIELFFRPSLTFTGKSKTFIDICLFFIYVLRSGVLTNLNSHHAALPSSSQTIGALLLAID